MSNSNFSFDLSLYLDEQQTYLTMNRIFKQAIVLFIFLGTSSVGLAQKPDNPLIWKKAMDAFAAEDSLTVPDADLIVFTGSSSIRGWRSLEQDFPACNVLNRGFGGSRIADATYYFDELLTKHNPKQVVFYSGDNDVAAGYNPDMVLERFKAFAEKFKEKLPDAELLFLSIKPSLARWSMYGAMEKANKMIKRYAFWHKNVTFVDVSTKMLGADGTPIPELFIGDGLHMTPKGYALWTKILAPYLVKGKNQ